jgi:hypothetical protein
MSDKFKNFILKTEFWNIETPSDYKLEDKTANDVNQVFNIENKIGLDSAWFLRIYLEHYLGIDESLPADWSDTQKEEFYDTYPEDISARDLQLLHPEIYKLGYVDKIKFDDILITNIKLKLWDGNKIQIQNDGGFTLNEIAYLAGQFFKTVNWFRENFKRSDLVIFLDQKKPITDTLHFSVSCDI